MSARSFDGPRIVALALTLCAWGCRADPAVHEAGASAEDPARLSAAAAAELVLSDLRAEKPDLHADVTTPLTEVTPAALWEEHRAQLFVVASGLRRGQAYLLHAGEVAALGGSFGGHGLTSAVVADVGGPAGRELLYTYSHGSGIHRSHVAAWSPEARAALAPSLTTPDVDLFVRAVGGAVRVEAGEYGGEFGAWRPVCPVGDVTWDASGALALELSPEVSERVRRFLGD